MPSKPSMLAGMLSIWRRSLSTSPGAVVTKEVNAAAMMCACEAFRNEVLDMQSRLAALANSMEHASEQRWTVDNFVDDVGWLIDSPWRDCPAAQPIRDAFDKLRADASAAFKV